MLAATYNNSGRETRGTSQEGNLKKPQAFVSPYLIRRETGTHESRKYGNNPPTAQHPDPPTVHPLYDEPDDSVKCRNVESPVEVKQPRDIAESVHEVKESVVHRENRLNCVEDEDEVDYIQMQYVLVLVLVCRRILFGVPIPVSFIASLSLRAYSR